MVGAHERVTIDGVFYEQWPLECPECGARLTLQKDKYGVHYKCTPPCRGAHGCHSDGKPLGIPASARVRKARSEAHEIFDVIWQKAGLTRTEAYVWMQRVMGLSPEDSHIGRMTVSQCRELVVLVRRDFPDFFPLTLDD